VFIKKTKVVRDKKNAYLKWGEGLQARTLRAVNYPAEKPSHLIFVEEFFDHSANACCFPLSWDCLKRQSV